MKRDLKVAPEATAPQEQKAIAGFYLPIEVMDQILGYIGRGPYFEVTDFIDHIKASMQPVFAKAKTQPNEAENQTAPTN